jgi:hypothetical protein
MIAKKEISTNKQIIIIPTANIMSSEEKYQLKEYFTNNSKQKLVGRLLVERFISQESYYFDYIESIPKDLEDYYHFSDKNRENFNKRSLVTYQFNNRKSDYEDLMSKIPTNVYFTYIGNTFIIIELGII